MLTDIWNASEFFCELLIKMLGLIFRDLFTHVSKANVLVKVCFRGIIAYRKDTKIRGLSYFQESKMKTTRRNV